MNRLKAATEGFVRRGRGLQADLRIITLHGRRFVLKDYSERSPTARVLGRYLISREHAALRRLRGVRGVPRLHARPSPLSLLVDYIEGPLFGDYPPGELPPEFFARLRQVVDDIHARGVAHADLKRKDNIIVAAGWQPYLVDFAASIRRMPALAFATNWLFRQMCEIDCNAIAKHKLGRAPQLLTDEERRRLARPLPLERLARGLLGR